MAVNGRNPSHRENPRSEVAGMFHITAAGCEKASGERARYSTKQAVQDDRTAMP